MRHICRQPTAGDRLKAHQLRTLAAMVSPPQLKDRGCQVQFKRSKTQLGVAQKRNTLYQVSSKRIKKKYIIMPLLVQRKGSGFINIRLRFQRKTITEDFLKKAILARCGGAHLSSRHLGGGSRCGVQGQPELHLYIMKKKINQKNIKKTLNMFVYAQ